MRILIVGNGGREHALAWKIRQSPLVTDVYCAPGNAGIAEIADCVPIDSSSIVEVADFAQTIKADLTVVGPELPMVLGIGDEFVRRGLTIFSPSRGAAEIEGSKVFAREFMTRHRVPSPRFEVCGSREEALAFAKKAPLGYPFVVKADGLAAGKGTVVVGDAAEASTVVEQIMTEKRFGSAGAKVVMEEFLQGEEVSFLVFSDGSRVVPMASVQDHKRAFDGDKGPNTGGMGTVSPTTNISLEGHKRIMQEVVLPTIAGLAAEGRRFQGVLFAGLMMTESGPKVLEFNARFGDPETQVIMARMRSDVVPILEQCARGSLGEVRIEWAKEPAVCVVVASRGYPDTPETGKVIEGLEALKEWSDVVVYHAATKREDGRVKTVGGRVLGVTALGAKLESAIARAYEAVGRVRFDGMTYRRDIGARALARLHGPRQAQPPRSRRMPGRRPVLAAAALALTLNLAGIGWGLPARFHPDEKADVVASMVQERRALPGSYVNPSLPLALTAPVIALQQALMGRWPEPWSDPLAAGRVLSALAGAAAVLLLGLAAALAHPEAAAPAAFLLALAPGVVNLCHFATPEAWVLAATSLTLLVATRHLAGRAPAWATGLVLGLAASTKYTAAALALPVLAALWMRRRGEATRGDRLAWLAVGVAALAAGAAFAGPPGADLASSLRLPDARLLHPESARAFVRGLADAGVALGGAMLVLLALRAFSRTAGLERLLVRREVVAAGLASLGGFVLGTPGAVLEPRAFLSDLAFNAQTRHEYKGLVGEPTSWGAYLGLGGDALTRPVLFAALLGLGVAASRLRRGSRAALVVALAALAPYALVASSGHRAMRFLAPALPAAVWLAGLALGAIPAARARRLLTSALIGRAAIGAILVVRLFFVDSRLLAGRWLEANVPRGATVDLITNHEGYAPRVPEGREARVLRTLSREMAPPERFEEAALSYPSEAAPWLVLTGTFYQRFLDHPEQRPERARFFRDLLEGRGGFEVRARFRQEGWLRPEADEFLDPEIVILRRTAAASR